MFLDTRPEEPAQRDAFRHYMESGGAWLGFHFSGFALDAVGLPAELGVVPRRVPGGGAVREQHLASDVGDPARRCARSSDHPGLAGTFRSAPSEWYRWEHDLRKNPDIRVLLSIDPSSFPLGTGPKPHEIWHSGDYPVVWTNTQYRMVYMNMGHNDMDYEHKTNRQLSSTFSAPIQNEVITRALLWLGGRRR